MEYIAKLTTEDGRWLVEFPDCPGCQTFGETKAEVLEMAGEALEGWLEAHLEYGDSPPRPKRHRGVPIQVRQRLAVAIQIRWLREDLGLTQRELAGKAGVSQQQIAKLEKPSGNPTIGTLEAIAKNSGAQLSTVLSVGKPVTPKRLAPALRSGVEVKRIGPKRSARAASPPTRDRPKVKPPRAA
jgi:predicted RNase H-like HicB family nuclease/transcriptional regulator with XRE-family HTH domain